MFKGPERLQEKLNYPGRVIDAQCVHASMRRRAKPRTKIQIKYPQHFRCMRRRASDPCVPLAQLLDMVIL